MIPLLSLDVFPLHLNFAFIFRARHIVGHRMLASGRRKTYGGRFGPLERGYIVGTRFKVNRRSSLVRMAMTGQRLVKDGSAKTK